MPDWTPELKREVATMIAEGKNSAQIAEAISLSKAAILAGNRRYDLGQFEVGHKAVIPPEVAELWPTHSVRDIAEKLKRGRGTISRWGKMLGLPSKLARDTSKARLTNNDHRKPRVIKHAGPPGPVDRPFLQEGPAGIAQRYLQRFGHVYRCNEGGSPNVNGLFWRCGSLILTDAQLIQRANEKRARERRAA